MVKLNPGIQDKLIAVWKGCSAPALGVRRSNFMSRNGLPENWENVQVKDIAESIQYGYTESSSKDNIGPKFLRITDIQDNRVDWRSVPFCKIDDADKGKYKLRDGDLVFARTGATVGKSFLIKGEIPDAIFASYLIRLRFPKTISDKFVFNFFQSHLYWKQIVEGQVGIGQPNVNGTKLGQLVLPIPPIDEQERIVAKIDELFSELDAGVESLKKAQAQLKTYRQAVLKSAFEGRLTNESVTEGELPDDWMSNKLDDIAEKITDGEHATPRRTSEGILLLSARNIQNGHLSLSDVDHIPDDEYERIIRRCHPEEGDILISCSGSVGRICRVPPSLKFTMVRSVALVKMDWAKYSSKYFEYLFQSPLLQKQIEKGKKATAQANLFIGPIKNLDVLICSLDEQQRIVEEIDSRLSVCDKLEETIAASLKQSEALRQSILKQAFEGKLVSS